MDKIGYGVKIADTVALEWALRKALQETPEGGEFCAALEISLRLFREAALSRDIHLLILAEETTLRQELALYGRNDPSVQTSLNAALEDFRVMKNAFAVVADAAGYRLAAATYHSKHQRNGIPADGFHDAVNSHIARLGNRVRTIGILKMEKDILRQRRINMTVARDVYTEWQQRALNIETRSQTGD